MAVNWVKDAEAGLSQAKQDHQPVLLDFSAAPA
jgi:hypothetical protein